ncbi:MAG: hypothetical protein CNLJKLNK_00072 [Holosporales bacterium]
MFLIATTLMDASYAMDEQAIQGRDFYKKEEKGRSENSIVYPRERIRHSITLDDALSREDEDLKRFTELVIPVEKSYTSYTDKGELKITERGRLINDLLEKMPNVTVVLDCGKKTRIEKNCLSKINIDKLVVLGEKVHVIEVFFLAGCTKLTGLDLTSLKNVVWIQNEFLRDCNNLKEVYIPKNEEFKDKLSSYILNDQIIERDF